MRGVIPLKLQSFRFHIRGYPSSKSHFFPISRTRRLFTMTQWFAHIFYPFFFSLHASAIYPHSCAWNRHIQRTAWDKTLIFPRCRAKLRKIAIKETREKKNLITHEIWKKNRDDAGHSWQHQGRDCFIDAWVRVDRHNRLFQEITARTSWRDVSNDRSCLCA